MSEYTIDYLQNNLIITWADVREAAEDAANYVWAHLKNAEVNESRGIILGGDDTTFDYFPITMGFLTFLTDAISEFAEGEIEFMGTRSMMFSPDRLMYIQKALLSDDCPFIGCSINGPIESCLPPSFGILSNALDGVE